MYRDGKVHEIPKRDVVVGDVVVLAQGDEIPADGRLSEAVSLQVNESCLTGRAGDKQKYGPGGFRH